MTLTSLVSEIVHFSDLLSENASKPIEYLFIDNIERTLIAVRHSRAISLKEPDSREENVRIAKVAACDVVNEWKVKDVWVELDILLRFNLCSCDLLDQSIISLY